MSEEVHRKQHPFVLITLLLSRKVITRWEQTHHLFLNWNCSFLQVVDIVSVLKRHKTKHCPILLITPLTLKRNQYNQQEKLAIKNELLYVYILWYSILVDIGHRIYDYCKLTLQIGCPSSHLSSVRDLS